MDVFTLISGDYVYGGAALCNSLRAVRFDGVIHVGCVGELPWTLDPAAPIMVHRLAENERWPGNRKPAFIAGAATGLFLYIDADCLLMRPDLLVTLAKAVSHGPVFCAEGIVPGSGLRRLRWRIAKESSLERRTHTAARVSDVYYNSGFLCGDVRRDRWLLEGWGKLIDTVLHGSGGLYETPDFPMPDQDCLNAFIQDEEIPYSCISPPDVWYAGTPASPFLRVGMHEAALLHCTGLEKPWQLTSVPPRAPNPYEKAWHHFLYEDARWVRCSLPMKRSVQSWLRDKPWGRGISRAKNLGRRLLAR